MSIIPSHTDEQLEALELFDRSLDNALKARLHPTCLHHAIDNRTTRPQLRDTPSLQPIGWMTIPGARENSGSQVALGTPTAHEELFRQPEQPDARDAARSLREFCSSVTRALEHWPRENLHRCVDAAYWTELAELFQRAGDHAWRATISGPRPHAA